MSSPNANDPPQSPTQAADPSRLSATLLPAVQPVPETGTLLTAGGLPAGAVPTTPVAVPGYAIESVLGHGGMGVVYKARHLTLKRTVALKMILAGGHAGPRELARFRIEAEAVARLQHPNIVQIHEVGEAQGLPYCALEFVAGGSLAHKIDGQPMPVREAARLVEALARAMQLAHGRNVVHRDLKPANILLAEDGTPKITDFGLARQTDSDSGDTQAGAVLGTPSYMAPEQASGNAHEAGPAADVYALGAILYDCLTGRPPFKGASVVETLDLVRTQEPVSPSRWRPGVPLDLETICLKCLRKEPEKRYASAAELADDLVRYQQGEPILARPVGRVERAVKWVRRNPAVTGAALVVVLALTLGTTVSYLKYLEALDQAARAERARDFLVSIFRIAETDVQGGNVTARQILADAEKRIPREFANDPNLRRELLTAIEEVKQRIELTVPAALILEASGAIEFRPARDGGRLPTAQTLLYPEDRLTLGSDAHLRLWFLKDLHQERLKPGSASTVGRHGCAPADAVLTRSQELLPAFVRLPKGTFYMGWDGKKKGVPTPIAADFEIAVHALTQGQWQAVMCHNPSFFSRQGKGSHSVLSLSEEELNLFPVEQVSWDDAQEFLGKLNENERGRGWLYRLPTEAEWEFACRGGATAEADCAHHFYFDRPSDDLSSAQANFNGDFPFGKAARGKYLFRPARVGAYPPNNLGLCDMHGNVIQWCADAFTPGGSERVARGGGWVYSGAHCQAAYRFEFAPSVRNYNVGFRLVRVPGRPRTGDGQ